MKTNQIYAKTLKFVWLKLGIGCLITVISIALFAIIAAICGLVGGQAIFVGTVIWILLSGGVYRFIMNYFGYMIKAAHIAVVSTAVTTGSLPQNMFETGKEMVKSRFGAANAYFVIDNLIGGAVKQLQKAVGKIENIAGNVPGISTLVDFAQVFIGIALGYIDECCIGYTFYKKEDGAFKAGCDGVAIYFQNIKHLLKSALVTSLIVVVLSFFAWLIPFILLALILGIFNIHPIFAALIAIFFAAAIKSAFIDSYVMVRTMVAYMQVAPSTQITFDIYGKLCKLSNKFKKLFDKANEEQPITQASQQMAQPVYQQAPQQMVQPMYQQAPQQMAQPMYQQAPQQMAQPVYQQPQNFQ